MELSSEFWIGLLGVVLTAMGVTPEMFTDWGIVVTQAKALISNPFMRVHTCPTTLELFRVLVNRYILSKI